MMVKSPLRDQHPHIIMTNSVAIVMSCLHLKGQAKMHVTTSPMLLEYDGARDVTGRRQLSVVYLSCQTHPPGGSLLSANTDNPINLPLTSSVNARWYAATYLIEPRECGMVGTSVHSLWHSGLHVTWLSDRGNGERFSVYI